VEELDLAGVAGLSIEDTLLPQAHGGGAASLISIEEGVGKIRAAREARSDTSLVIAGRTSAAAMTSVGDAIARVTAYEAAGADAIFLVGVRSRADLEAIAGEISLPLIVGGVDPTLIDLDYLGGLGVRLCLQGHQPFAASVNAVFETLKALRDGTPPSQLENIAPKEMMNRVTRSEDYARWTDEFL
jgi:carboxyvinyl-carboxyphosphonate phosphorylmutase